MVLTFYLKCTLTHYHTIPHFDALKMYSCRKHCEKRRNCLEQAISPLSQCFLPYMVLTFYLKCTLTHYHTIPHFDALKMYSCRKHCEKRKNCLFQAISPFSQCFLPYLVLIFYFKCTLTYYYTMPHFDALKIYSCRKHCKKRKNCLEQAIFPFAHKFSTIYGTYFPF